jgi:hypothetical protein
LRLTLPCLPQIEYVFGGRRAQTEVLQQVHICV